MPALHHVALNSSHLDHFISFDSTTGILEAEAGVTLERILNFCIPKGFFLPVTPGTKFVSLGGALASNVHGKNHHKTGSIEHFVIEMEVATPAGTFVCSLDQNRELFLSTMGGYGLTGAITRAKLKLKPVQNAQVECLRVKAANIDDMFGLFAKHDPDYEYSVAWLDTLAKGRKLGRGILMLGNHAQVNAGERKIEATEVSHKFSVSIPFAMPDFLLNEKFLTLFNRAFYLVSGNGKRTRENFESYFYPLDRIGNWNLLYGKSGFFQYQCVIPDPKSEEGILACLNFLSENRLGAFLSVLKRCGDDEVLLLFCKKGYTLALDIPFRGPETLKSLDRLDELVLKFGGRVYLTKDARLKPDMFRAMYPEFKEWMETVRRFNPNRLSSSRMAERLELWNES